MKDRFLSVMAMMAEDADSAPLVPRVTLLVGGMLVSGSVISRAEYVGHSALLGDIERAASKMLANEAPTQDEIDNPPPVFLHLKDAFYCVPGQPPIPEAGTYARISLHAISGFSLAGRVNS